MIWLQHILFLILIVASPMWDYFEIPRLKASPERKIPFYLQIIASQWPISAIVLFVAGRALWHPPPSWPWVRSPNTPAFLWGFIGGLTIVMLLAFLGLLKPKSRDSIRAALKKLEYLLPSNPRQDFWFAAVCITAGVCEEWLFRGFLLHYLSAGPWHMSMAVAIILSAGIFGLNHLYQGIAGMAVSAVLGVFLALIYLVSGSLLLPMIIHALLDLRALGLTMGARERAQGTT